MANYLSAYTGAQIDTAVLKINSIDGTSEEINTSLLKISDINYTASEINAKLSSLNILDLVTNTSGATAWLFGELLIQKLQVNVPQGSTQTIAFPIPYTECFAVWASCIHGMPGNPFSSPWTIVCTKKSDSEFYIYLNSGVSGASMGVIVYSFGI